MVKTYDSKSYELAEHFLDDGVHYTIRIAENHKRRCHELALAIQQTVEDWIEADELEERKQTEHDAMHGTR